MTGRLLILTLYYPPDLSAGSFRATALVGALRRFAPELSIDVITSLPNRYLSFSTAAAEEEVDGLVTIHRLRMPSHRSDMVTQAFSYARFARAAAQVASERRYDLVFATSSRLMTAALGAWVSRRSETPLYLDIRDLFVDTMASILPRRVSRVVGPLFSAIERRTMGRASHINLVSQGFEPYFRERYPTVPLSFFTNGIDDEFVMPIIPSPPRVGPVTVLYAGNMGEGQGLHAIVPQLARRLDGRARFRLIGDGGRRGQLMEAVGSEGVTNVEVLPPMAREKLVSEYQAADVLFLHLNDYEAFTRVLPSKIFEYGAMGKPIWAGVGGYAADFLRTQVTNVAVFPPCDVSAGMRAWETLDLGTAPRDSFVKEYARRDIMERLAAHLLSHLRLAGFR